MAGERFEGARDRRVAAVPLEIGEKDVLPHLVASRPRLDPAQVDAFLVEDLEDSSERSFVIAAAMYWIDWKQPSWPALAVKSLPSLAVVAALGSIVMLGIIGHSGASAVWTQVQALPSAPGYGDG